MILIITSSFDKTVDYIEKKHNVKNLFRFNINDFSSYQVSYDSDGFKIVDRNFKSLKEKDCTSIYYRKPTPEDLLSSGIAKEYHPHIYREVFTLIDGIVDSFEGICLSKPSIIRRADNKISQAKLAKKIGFTLPELVITNHFPFIEQKLTHPIIKPLSSGVVETSSRKEFVQTNLVDRKKETTNLKYSPSYFQEYQDKDFEVRVTIVKNSFFPVRIDSKDKIDWRKSDNQILYSNTDIPDEIKDKCLMFMLAFGIEYGCFDFIVHNETWYFLEMNANGQWAWLDAELNMNISGAILEYLNHE
ncbi:TPA: MvdC/MvdD family ATP grasp protein [Serratia marcescens]|uniref:MvdC/MvdD family ATP grasp protein n=1 Tax=Serratia marcescens TaxID=615 RepID=UPI000A18BE7F|nr:hypothetical protein [Serratia marcescens]HCR3025572.1 hypothetical protein [Serratia marcescens]